MDPGKIEEIRKTSFPAARRGYDRDAVDDFLDRLATSLEQAEGLGAGGPVGAVQQEITRLGERTSGILSAAEDAAAKVRAEAKETAATAKEEAAQSSRKVVLEASQKAERLVADAEARAEKIIDDAVVNRRRLNQAVSSLAERRDEIAAETMRLADELHTAVDRLSEFELREKEAPGTANPALSETASAEALVGAGDLETEPAEDEPYSEDDPQGEFRMLVDPEPESEELVLPRAPSTNPEAGDASGKLSDEADADADPFAAGEDERAEENEGESDGNDEPAADSLDQPANEQETAVHARDRRSGFPFGRSR